VLNYTSLSDSYDDRTRLVIDSRYKLGTSKICGSVIYWSSWKWHLQAYISCGLNLPGWSRRFSCSKM